MTLLKDNNYKDINIALLSLEADIKKLSNNNYGGFDAQLADINKRIDEINASGGSDEIKAVVKNLKNDVIAINSNIDNIENDITTINSDIDNIEQQLSNIFSAKNKVTDFNTTTNSGIYYWITDAANKPTNYGVLLVNKFDGGTSIWINQIAYGTNGRIYFRQKINDNNWRSWRTIAFDGEITANKVANALTVNGKTYDGSSAVDAGVQSVENGGTGVTTQADINKAFVGNLEEGNDNVTDGTMFVSSWASDKGFAYPSGLNKPYKRQFIKVWNYIKDKISSVLGLTKDNYGGTAAKVASAGGSGMWIQGRANSICKTTSAGGGGGWKTLASIKTSSGSIEIGNLSGEDYIRIVYSSDTDVNAGNNNVSQIMQMTNHSVEFPTSKTSRKMVIPIGAPSTKENGCIWIG